VLQCDAVCRSVLQCVAVCRSVLQCVAVRCNVAVCCSALQCVAVCCSAVQCCSALQCVEVLLQCVAVLLRDYLVCLGNSISIDSSIGKCCNVSQFCCSVLQGVAVCCSIVVGLPGLPWQQDLRRQQHMYW